MSNTKQKRSANRLRFRAWDRKEKKMWPVLALCFYGRPTATLRYNPVLKKWNDDLCLMQSTGLTDKNGKEIFEGDVVRIGGVIWTVGWYTQSSAFWIFSTSATWDTTYIASQGAPARDWNWLNGGRKVYWHKSKESNDVEVIGNVYEHPSLLNPAK